MKQKGSNSYWRIADPVKMFSEIRGKCSVVLIHESSEVLTIYQYFIYTWRMDSQLSCIFSLHADTDNNHRVNHEAL